MIRVIAEAHDSYYLAVEQLRDALDKSVAGQNGDWLVTPGDPDDRESDASYLLVAEDADESMFEILVEAYFEEDGIFVSFIEVWIMSGGYPWPNFADRTSIQAPETSSLISAVERKLELIEAHVDELKMRWDQGGWYDDD